MILVTEKQMRKMAKDICEQRDGMLITDFLGNEIEVKYFLDYVETFEDDYFNGTGASNIDKVEFYIDDVTCYDEEVFFDEHRLKEMVVEYLTA